MLSAFEMRPDQDEAAFLKLYQGFVDDLLKDDLILAAGPPGRRMSDTPMDTDETRRHTHFSILSFRDRAQLDAAYAALARRSAGATDTHHAVNASITNSVFLCWQDLPDPTPKEP